MIRVVLDANVLISGLLSKEGPPGQILDAWLSRKYQLCMSSLIIDELSRVLDYRRIRERLNIDKIQRFLILVATNSILVPAFPIKQILTRDPSDNIYLSCAYHGKAKYLVTGNLVHF